MRSAYRWDRSCLYPHNMLDTRAGRVKYHPCFGRSDDQFDQFGYRIAYVHGERTQGKKREFLVAWEGFSFRDDTWQEKDDIYPSSKMLKYENSLATIHVLGEPLADVRDALARRMCSKVIGERRPAWQLPLERCHASPTAR